MYRKPVRWVRENVRHNIFYYIIQRAKYRVERVYKQKNRKRTAIAAVAMLSLALVIN